MSTLFRIETTRDWPQFGAEMGLEIRGTETHLELRDWLQSAFGDGLDIRSLEELVKAQWPDDRTYWLEVNEWGVRLQCYGNTKSEYRDG